MYVNQLERSRGWPICMMVVKHEHQTILEQVDRNETTTRVVAAKHYSIALSILEFV